MRDRTTRAQLAVALIGIGPTWEHGYREAVRRLSTKLSVRAVCDAVHVRAATVAEEFHAATYSSPWQLAQRTDVRAWLILDTGWLGLYPAELSVRIGRPALFTNTFVSDASRLAAMFHLAADRGDTLMAEFPQRFAPATTRLRELIATRLGLVRKIEIHAPLRTSTTSNPLDCLGEQRPHFASLFDWCACLFGRSIAAAEWVSADSGSVLRLICERVTGESESVAPSADILFVRHENCDGAPDRREVICERGHASIFGATRISWKSVTDHANETLTNERSPFEIVLDQFCRRVLGGLVPVPTMADASRALATVDAAAKALVVGTRQVVTP